MRNTTRQTRENRTITVDFHNETTYYQLLGDGKTFVECVLAFLLSIGLQLTHKTTCNGGGCLTLHSHYMRVRLGGLTIWRLQCTRCKAVFTVLPHFVLRYHSIPPNVARNALLATHGGLSLELCAVIYQTLSGLTRAEQAQYIECGERVTATHAEIVQAARHLHDEIRDTLCGETQHLFDHATPFYPGHHVFYDRACAGDERIEEPVLHAQHLAFRFFLGGRVSTPAGSEPCKPVSLPSVALGG